MAVVRPFSAWHYNLQKFNDLNKVVAPPYDVISDSDLAKMKSQSQFNYTHIILPGSDKHTQAAGLFQDWKNQEVLVQDKVPSLYFYQQTFNLTPLELFCQAVPESVRRGGPLTRTALFCRVGLEEYKDKIILPHEKTFSGPKADRYRLMEETGGNMEPVFLGYDSPRFSGDEFTKVILGRKPTFSFVDDAKVKHEVWSIDDEKVIKEVEIVLAAKKFFILDGHHRYETALKYFQDHQKTDARLDHRYVLAAICSFRQPGTIILPTHRGVKNGNVETFKKQAVQKGWTWSFVDKREDLEIKLKGTPNGFGLKIQESKGYGFLDFQGKKNKLNLEILHEELLPLLADKPEIDYIKDLAEIESGVAAKRYTVGFLVGPSTVDEVMAVAERGSVMPHKSTFFYPKIPSGLLINTFS